MGLYAQYCLMMREAEPDRDAADRCLWVAADRGYPRALLARAMRLNTHGQEEQAYRDLLRSVESTRQYAGVWDGTALLSRFCLEGLSGAQRSPEQAFRWAEQGAQHGSAAALGTQGALEMLGIGTQMNAEAGAEHIAAAAALGDADSIHRMALMYRYGVAVQQDEERSGSLAGRCDMESVESADGLGFDWLLPEEKAPQAETPESEAPQIEAVQLEARQPEASQAEAAQTGEAVGSGAPSRLFTCICSVLNRMDDEFQARTGEIAPENVLVDTLLACLNGAMSVSGGDGYRAVIHEFCVSMPDFVELGYDEAYLERRYRTVSGTMQGYRQELRTILQGEQSMREPELTYAVRFMKSWIRLPGPMSR